jgi:DNA helicase-2/ATP-dependent DNA helicase PcrA
MNYSEEQEIIFKEIENGKGNIMIQAVAGSGKTTTIIKSMDYIKANKKILFLAFNKSVKNEIENRITKKSNVNISTLHSLGFSLIMSNNRGRRFNIDTGIKSKYSYMLRDMEKSGALDEHFGDDYSEKMNYIEKVQKLIDYARLNLALDVNSLSNIAHKYSIVPYHDEIELALKLITKGLKGQNFLNIDYVDMIFYPVFFRYNTNVKYDYVFLDEMQDSTKLTQEIIKKVINTNGKLIAVGDIGQTIYGFAGSDTESVENIKKLFNTKQLKLTTNYRCGKKIIDLAKKYVPDIRAYNEAPEGVIIEEGKNNMIEGNIGVLCRNAAPLVALFLENIAKGNKGYFIGKDILNGFTKTIDSTRKSKLGDIVEALEKKKNDEISKLYKKGYKRNEALEHENVTYYIDVIALIIKIVEINNISTKKQLYSMLDHIINQQDYDLNNIPKDIPIYTTVHKAKGLEFDKVMIIHRDLFYKKDDLQQWESEQLDNLHYVALTRAKNELIFNTEYVFYKNKKTR